MITPNLEANRLPPTHGQPHDRGGADAYYGRGKQPHYYQVNNSGLRVRVTDLTPEQVAEYNRGYDNEGDRKDWGHDEE